MLAERNLPDDGRAIWNDSWTESCVKMGSADDDWRGGGDAVGTTFSSFDAIDMIFEKLGDRRLYPNLRRVVLTGFSAGAQYAVDGTPWALLQGRSRYERFVNFEKYLREGHPNWIKQVTFHPMEGLGHDSPVAHRLPGFIDYVLGKGDK